MAEPGKPSKQKTQALALLDGILEDTKKEASSEEQRLKRELEAKRRREMEEKENEERRRREEAQRRIDEEVQRRNAAEERRAAAAEQLRIEDLKEKGLWKEPEPEVKPQLVAQPVGVQRPLQTTAEVIAATKKSKLPLIAAAAVVIGLGGAAAAYVVLGNREYVDSTTTYSRVEVQTVALAEASQVVGFRAIPLPEPVVAEVAPAAQSGRGDHRSGQHRAGASSAPAEREAPRLQLGGSLTGH